MSALRDDYRRFVDGTGYVLPRDWTCVSVRGADRAALLNNLCTNTVATLRPGEGCEAFFTDVKGHVLAHTIVLCRDEEILLLTVPSQAERLIGHLDRYIIREDVELQDRSQATSVIVATLEACSRLVARDISGEIVHPFDNVNAEVDGADVLFARCGWFGSAAVVMLAADDKVDSLATVLSQASIEACPPELLESLRIESGTPYFGVDFDASNLPQEVNRNQQAISFTKGCYLGQETVARIDALGHVNKMLVRVRFDGEQVPTSGTPLFAGEKEVGKVTSAVWSPRLAGPLALAMVRRGHNEVGTVLDSTAGKVEVVKSD